MTDTPRDFAAALLYCREQHATCSPPSNYGSTWENDCQAFVHCAYGLFTGGFGSAYAQWLGLAAADRHATTDLSTAPVGALLFSKGANAAGHVWIAARPFADGTPASWSTDLWRTGLVGKVPRTAAHDVWGHTNLGWGTSVNGYRLDLTHTNAVARPIQTKRYLFVDDAITKMEGALATAKKQNDTHDVRLLKSEIADLKKLYSNLRHR